MLLVLLTVSRKVATSHQTQPNSTNPIVVKSESEFTGKVAGIADGDTATVLDDEYATQIIVIDALAKLRVRGETLCVVPQNLIEFWVVATRQFCENTNIRLTKNNAPAKLFSDKPKLFLNLGLGFSERVF